MSLTSPPNSQMISRYLVGQIKTIFDLSAPLLLCFEAVSRLKVNLPPSGLLLASNVPSQGQHISVYADIHTEYRASFGASFKAKSIWYGEIVRIEHHLAFWKKMYLSNSGRITLIKSTLYNFSRYFVIVSTSHQCRQWDF